jgi:hypothetical protein
MNMSSENFWELFTETGDITYYLLYNAALYSAASDRASAEKNERSKPEQTR